jgi:hypothetical protein
MTNDFITDIRNDMERINYCKYRFFNEPDTWWGELLKEVSDWLKTGTDILVKNFITTQPWFPHNAVIRNQYPENVDGQDVLFQWTISNHGQNVEFAVKKIDSIPSV